MVYMGGGGGGGGVLTGIYGIWPKIPEDLSLWGRPACQTQYFKWYGSSSSQAVKNLIILSDANVRRSAVDLEDLKPNW